MGGVRADTQLTEEVRTKRGDLVALVCGRWAGVSRDEDGCHHGQDYGRGGGSSPRP